MSKTLTSLIFTISLLGLSGCDKFQASPSSVVLDLDAIAQATGQAATIQQQIESANQELNTQLATISTKLNEQLIVEKDKLGKKPSKADKENLEKLTLQANQKMQQAKAIATQKAQQYRAALILQLRNNVKPIAEEIASKRGAKVVLSSNNSMIWFDPEIDITDEVIAAIRATPATGKPKTPDAIDSDKTTETPVTEEK